MRYRRSFPGLEKGGNKVDLEEYIPCDPFEDVAEGTAYRIRSAAFRWKKMPLSHCMSGFFAAGGVPVSLFLHPGTGWGDRTVWRQGRRTRTFRDRCRGIAVLLRPVRVARKKGEGHPAGRRVPRQGRHVAPGLPGRPVSTGSAVVVADRPAVPREPSPLDMGSDFRAGRGVRSDAGRQVLPAPFSGCSDFRLPHAAVVGPRAAAAVAPPVLGGSGLSASAGRRGWNRLPMRVIHRRPCVLMCFI